MADNKKKKANWTEALKAQAEKLVPKVDTDKDNDEVIDVDLDGMTVPVARSTGKNRIPDDVWEQVKKRAAQPVEDLGGLKSEPVSWAKLMSIAQDTRNEGKGLLSEEEHKLLEKTNEWDRAEFIRQRMKSKGYKVPINSAQDERASVRGDLPEKPAAPYISQKEMKAQTQQYKADKGKIGRVDETPTEKQGNPETDFLPMPGGDGTGTRAPGTQTEMEGGVSSAGGVTGSSPFARAMSMAQLAATGATPKFPLKTTKNYEVGYGGSSSAQPGHITDSQGQRFKVTMDLDPNKQYDPPVEGSTVRKVTGQDEFAMRAETDAGPAIENYFMKAKDARKVPQTGMPSIRNPASYLPSLIEGKTGARPTNPRAKTRMMPELDLRPGQHPSAAEAAADAPPASPESERLKQVVQENEAAAQMQNGLDFSTPESRLAAVVNERIKQPPSYQEVTDNGDASVTPTITDNNDTTVVPVAKPLQFGKDALSAAAAGEGIDNAPAPRTDLINFDGNPSSVPPSPVLDRVLDMSEPTRPQANPSAVAQAPAQNTQGQPVSMGGSIAVSGKIPGNTKAPKPVVDPLAEQIAQNAREKQALLAADTELQSKKISSEADLMRKAELERAKLANENQQRVEAEAAEMRKHENGLRDLQNEVLSLSKESIDPNRFWANKDSGQKAAAVIAGALFGFTGQGMQWLQRIDSLVAQDIQAQNADLSRRRGLLSDATGVQNSLIDMAEKKGLRGQAAYNAAVATAKENLANQIQMNAMNYADPALKIKAEQMAAEIRISAQKEISDLGINARKNALDAGLKVAQINHLNAQSYAARIAADTKATKGEDLDKLDPAALSRLEAIDKALAAAKEARAAIKGAPGDNRLVDQIAKNWVSTLNAVGLDDVAKGMFPKTSGRLSAARQGQKTVLKGVMGEAINNEDIKDTAPMWGTPGIGNTTGWLDSQEEVLTAERNAIVENARKAKRDIGGLGTQTTAVRSFTPSVK